MQIDNNDTNNGQQSDAVVNDNNAGNAASDSGNDGIDAAFAKHLDIAIEAQDGPAKVETTPTKEGESDQSKQPVDKSGGDGDGAAQPDNKGKEPSVTEAARTLARAKDLKLQDGTVVKGGAERRFYEQREAARQQLSTEQREHQITKQRLDDVTRERDTIKQAAEALHGMDPKTVRLGATIVADLQRDPVGTMQKLLAETIAQGYTIEQIGANVDMAAITRLIDERLPKQNTETRLTDEQITSQAREEVVTFYGEFPDAQPHDALIARVLQDHPQMSLKDVYFQLKNSFAEHGFDWSRSLEENLREVSNTDNAGQSQTDPTKTQQQPLPNGRGGDEEFRLNRSGNADVDQDTGDIVKEAMREAGLNI